MNKIAAVSAGVVGLLAIRSAMRQLHRLNLQNKTVFVTGGSRGLGLALAREFVAHGARVAVCARDDKELDAARSEFGNVPTFLALHCDVRSRSEVERALAEAERRLGPVEVLVNNAGTILAGPMENQDIAAYEDAMNTHFWGPLYASMAVIDGMKRRRRGRIVNVASIGGKVAVPHLLAYSASKFALVGFSQGLRAELAKDNVYVTTVCPGLMRTGSPRNANFTGQHEKEYSWFTLSDSLPGLSISASRAARRIVDACINGEAEVQLGASAKAASLLQGIAPAISALLLAQINRLLPSAADRRVSPKKGYESETPLTRSGLTALTRSAEQSFNQV